MDSMMAGLTTAITLWALWIRRSAHSHPWEGAPTVTVATAGAAAFMTNAVASKFVGRPLYEATGLANLEDVIGHAFGIACVSAACYMLLARFGDDLTLRIEFRRRILVPVAVLWPTMFACYLVSEGSTTYGERFAMLTIHSVWLSMYWTLLTGVLLYLLALATLMLLRLRKEDGRCLVTNMYLATFLMMMVFLMVRFVHIMTPADFHPWLRVMGLAYVLGWVATGAISWRQKAPVLSLAVCDRPGAELESRVNLPALCVGCTLRNRCPKQPEPEVGPADVRAV